MEQRIKERLVGAVALVAIVVIVVPELLTGPRPPAAVPAAEAGLHTVTIDLAAGERGAITRPNRAATASSPSAGGTPNSDPAGTVGPPTEAVADTPAATSPTGSAEPSKPKANNPAVATGTEAPAVKALPEEPAKTAAAPAPAPSPQGVAAVPAAVPAAVVAAAATGARPADPAKTANAAKTAKAVTAAKTATPAKTAKSSGDGKPTAPPASPPAVAKSGTKPPAKVVAATTPAGAAKVSGHFVVQVATLSTQDRAQGLATALRAKGYKVTVSAYKHGKETLYRVRLPTDKDRAHADELAQRLKKDGQHPTVVPQP
jgi:cell division septation protein DedD